MVMTLMMDMHLGEFSSKLGLEDQIEEYYCLVNIKYND